MRRVLVVCSANQCRSPMAEALIRARAAAESSGALEVRSAGTWTQGGAPATANAIAVMSELGIDITSHRSQEVVGPLLEWADLVLVMTAGHREAVVGEFPQAGGKVSLMSSLGGGEWDVADPVGGSLEDYRATAAELERLVRAGWRAVTDAATG